MATEVCYTANGGPVTCYTISAPIKWYQDPALYEFLSTRAFWALGIFIITNCYWVDQQTERYNAVEEAQKYSDASAATGTAAPATTTSSRRNLFWLQPHITSRPRQILAIILFSLVIPLQLLEGYWVLWTAWRITAASFGAAGSISLWPFRYVVYVPVTAITLISWFIVLVGGMFVVNVQLLYVLQLRELHLNGTSRPTDHERKAGDAKSAHDKEIFEDEKRDKKGPGN